MSRHVHRIVALPLAVALAGFAGCASGDASSRDEDAAFAALQERGQQAMGVDQYTSTHLFDALADGGRIELQRDPSDAAGVAQIRQHLQEITQAFKAGDFSTPAFVHMQDVPGTSVMAAKRDAIAYGYRELPGGGELRIVTSDPQAIEAVHAFMAFQREDHRASGAEHDHAAGATGAMDHSGHMAAGGAMDHGASAAGAMDHTAHMGGGAMDHGAAGAPGGTMGGMMGGGMDHAQHHPGTDYDPTAMYGPGGRMGGGMMGGGMGGGMMGGGMMGGGMMGGMHGGDEAYAADMQLVHELLVAHEAIERTVTDLPNGVRAVTESSIPEVAAYIKEHVASMQQRMLDGEEFNVASPTIPVLFANADKIHTVIEVTPRGIIFTQTTNDPALTPVLQAHAAEVSELVDEGMAAMMRGMMQQQQQQQGGGGMMRPPPAAAPPGGGGGA